MSDIWLYLFPFAATTHPFALKLARTTRGQLARHDQNRLDPSMVNMLSHVNHNEAHMGFVESNTRSRDAALLSRS